MKTFLKGIKNIIFDFGGVILNINPQLSIDAFKKLGVNNLGETYSELEKEGLFESLETGQISTQEFREEIKKLTNNIITEIEIDTAWCAMLLDYPKERIDLLLKLKNQYKIFLLSNTNKIHHKYFSNKLLAQYNITFNEIFEKTYFSHQIGKRKPDLDIYKKVISENNLNCDNTLFIDDSITNIEGAEKIGLNTYFLRKNETINQLFG